MKNKKLEAVALQLPSSDSYSENLDRLIELIDRYKDKKLIVAPEVYLTAYDYDNIEKAAIFSKKALDTLVKIVDEKIVVLTLILKKGEDYVNQAVVIHNHKIVHRQEKAKLFKMGDEDRYLKAGNTKEIKPFEIDGIKYALLICFELRFKELWKQIEGVEIVLIPARWGLPRKLHLQILSKALAVMNQCYVIVANSSDEDMASSSAIISPDGTHKEDDNSIAIEETLDLKEVKKMRRYIVMH